MPPGSLVPRDVRKKLGVFEKFVPKEFLDQIKILSEAERSFVIPVKIMEDGKEKYLIIAGMLLNEKVPVTVSFDEVDLQLVEYALEKAKNVLSQKQKKEEQNQENKNTDEKL